MLSFQLRDLVEKRKDEVKERHDQLLQELEMERKKVSIQLELMCIISDMDFRLQSDPEVYKYVSSQSKYISSADKNYTINSLHNFDGYFFSSLREE